ncbi:MULTISPECIES: VirB4-like conjugal transfer ATPase, CD1110 family [unclassified Enterococcus]|uniref:VirB4-like conjugal transfer ATPase, CD1110 family n=1 Tax=unclassified Enterococcus TaxID=2608891 RepID=UPI001CE097FB|nr:MULTISPECIES: TraC-F-type conjugal transfer protein [unclassified Enterococcus]MCA5014559.1 TraC-F-type conjugal transfer protein [Enterococcus sp. S23]MCA5017812.1 TraC-F-type conjugal transfer protein [Enterococcus sp. S22(2020)]
MNLLKKRPSKKQMRSKQTEKQIKQRVMEKANPTAQDSIKYTSQFQEGLMHIVEGEYSKTFHLGEVDYEVSMEQEQEDIVVGYADGLNTLDKNSRYQLLVLNKRIKDSLLESILVPYAADNLDNYRQEMNEIIDKQFQHDQRNFTIEKYATFTTKSSSRKQANKNLDTIAKNFKNRFEANDVDLSVTPLNGVERLSVMNELLRPGSYFGTTYQDIAVSGLNSKAFIVPNKIRFVKEKRYMKLGEYYAAAMYVRQYPKYLEDRLIRELCAIGIELAISIHATPYDMIQAKKNIQTMQTLNNVAISKQQKDNFRSGVSEDMIAGDLKDTKESTEALMEEIKENGQKMFSGIFTTFVIAKTEAELEESIKAVEDVGYTWQVDFEVIEDYKEEALNTILPIGKPYLDVEMNYMRDMTSTNVASQVPFTNIELQSPTGQYYGRNQMTNNVITVDRKKDLPTPSGLIFGTSGSGKGMATKWEMISALLRYPKDLFRIVDPESEYIPIARAFGAEILDISTGTQHHLNILDMVDSRLLDSEDRNVDLIKEKANLLSNLFESLLKSYTDEDASIVDRVTRQTYAAFEGSNEVPTLVEWYDILLEQPEPEAKSLATKVETYCIGSQDIFAHKTNIDLNAKFVVFNIKKLDEKMKPFAMKVILDQIWKQVVANQGKVTTRLYFDELQVNFEEESSASWFLNLWVRIRKYGAVTTGITQNISTMLDSPAGRKMISNSEFMILLRQKPVDLQRLKEAVNLKPKLLKYVGEKVPQGTGLIYANGTIVPFENPIPANTELFEIMNTDAA